MLMTELAIVAIIFTMFFAGVVMLGQSNLNDARRMGLAKADYMAKLLVFAKAGGLISLLSFVGLCALASPKVTFYCVTLAIGISVAFFPKRLLANQWEQVLLRGFIPTLLLACAYFQIGSGALRLPVEMVVDIAIVAMSCWLTAAEAAPAAVARTTAAV